MEHRYRFKLIIEPCEEGGYFGRCPALQGCYVQGETYEETLTELKASVDAHVQDRLERGEPIPDDEVSVEVYEKAVAA